MQRIILQFGDFRVAIAQSAIKHMEKYCQHGLQSHEACGILLGYEWDHAAEIVAATSPQLSDLRHRCGYTRDTEGHIAVAMELWIKSKETVGYLGEWHTHPERIPYPSFKDINEAKRIARENNSYVISLVIGTTHGCGFIARARRISHMQRFLLTA